MLHDKIIAQDAQRFKEEIVPVSIRSKQPFEFSVDEHPRPQTTFERLQTLKPVFKENGIVTAGSASVLIIFDVLLLAMLIFIIFRVFAMVQVL